MATESVATNAETITIDPHDTRGDDRDIYNNVMDGETADALFKAMSVLAMGIEATTARKLDRAFANWPNTAEAVWDMLNGIMVRAGMSDGKEHPWVSAKEAEERAA